jgi:hypothetical protein
MLGFIGKTLKGQFKVEPTRAFGKVGECDLGGPGDRFLRLFTRLTCQPYEEEKDAVYGIPPAFGLLVKKPIFLSWCGWMGRNGKGGGGFG